MEEETHRETSYATRIQGEIRRLKVDIDYLKAHIAENKQLKTLTLPKSISQNIPTYERNYINTRIMKSTVKFKYIRIRRLKRSLQKYKKQRNQHENEEVKTFYTDSIDNYKKAKSIKLIEKFKYPSIEEINEWKKSLVLNKTNYAIPENILEIMQKGLDFNGPNNWRIIDIIPTLDKACAGLTEVDSEIMKINLSNIIKHHIIRQKDRTIIRDKNYYKYNAEIEKLYKYLNDNNLNIIKADKSKQIVVVTRDWIIAKKLEIINKGNFRELPINPKNIIYEELKKRINILYKQKKVTKNEKIFILSEDNERTPRLNIQLKTHKQNEKVRPIVDFKFTVLYNLEKYLKGKLKDYENSICSIRNMEGFLQELKEVQINNTSKLASIDVVEMYPSITWKLINNQLNKMNVDPYIIDLIEFAYKSNYLELNNKYYTQEDGISMGSVIGPKLAELIMIEIDIKIKNILGIDFYRRYVDDILIVYNEAETTIDKIEELINGIHNEIKFTIEKEKTDNSIAYLDVMIKRKNRKLILEPFRKQCSVNKTLNYRSNIPLHIKRNIFYMEYMNILSRTSEQETNQKYINSLKKKFSLNGYPTRLINNWQKNIHNKGPFPSKKDANNKKIKYLSFPYIKCVYEKINKELRKNNIQLAPNYKNLISRLNQKQRSTNNIEDKNEIKNVVYKIPCTCENNSFYIGETKRTLKTRVKEHISDLKYSRLNSAFYDHCVINNCNINQSNIQILHKEKRIYDRKFKESVEILRNKNQGCINKNLSVKIHNNWLKII
ncbi:uncharacterized protein MAL8P1.12-like [Centruroides vittatus]|uniref:uncharacterized protein MAL8P1.12-like n=1 Tax=Centruroides vittatus TaxID=120091 RepID=UPI003510689A